MAKHLIDIFIVFVMLFLPIYNAIILSKIKKEMKEKREDK